MSLNIIESAKTAAVQAGIKSKGLDLGMIYFPTETVCSAVFTRNKIKAAPVIYDKELMAKNRDIRAVVVNSGNANACNSNGFEAIEAIVSETARRLSIEKEQVFVASTGVIGEDLPYQKIVSSLDELIKNLGANSRSFAEAIMTTDTFTKECAIKCSPAGNTFCIGAAAKGAGMIHPNMATMLAFIVTDIRINSTMLDQALKHAVDHSFNRISVDGDTSTNDTVFLATTQEAANEEISDESELYRAFEDNLTHMCTRLAKMIVMDGEGATKLAEVIVVGAEEPEDAENIARTVANSLLVKTALFGSDPNWGRIVDAVGYANAYVNPNKLKVYIGNHPVFADGKKVSADYSALKNYMKGKEIKILIDIGVGTSTFNMWFSDISYDYVKINAEYHT